MKYLPTCATLALLLSLASPSSLAAGVTLNLTDADIQAVITTVSEITGRNFIVDPRVKGKVTIVSSRPLDKTGVYQVFLSVLEVHGFAAVPAGDVVKIVPDANAKQSAIPTTSDSRPGGGDETVTRVIDVKHVQAAQLVPILRPLVAQQGHMAAYPQSNVVIISDRAANVQRIAEIIRRIDEPSQGEIEVVQLRHASASEVVRVLSTLTQQEKGKEGAGPSSTAITLVADERTNTVLLGGDKADRLRLRAIISHLDTPLENTGGNTTVIYLRYAQAKDLVNVLTGVSKGQETAAGHRSSGGNSGGGAVVAPVPAAGGSGSSGTFKDVSIQADEATNSLIITAPPDQLRTLQSVIRQLDIRRAQVLVEAIIAEVSATRASDLGVQWVADGSQTNAPVGIIDFPRSGGAGIASAVAGAATGGTAGGTAVLSALGSGLNLGVGDFSGRFRFGALIRALSSDGSSNILSTPNLLTLDNQEAEIVVGQNVPFVTGSYSNSLTGTTSTSTTTTGTNSLVGNPFQTIQRQDVGLTLKVKPQINEGDAVKLEIQQEVSSLIAAPEGIHTSDVVTSKRSIKTVVLAEDGQVVVMGGLMDNQVRESRQKVPLLGDLPVVGNLFRASTTNVDKRNLMVFLHPIILRDGATGVQLSGSKYNYMRDRQLEAMEPERFAKQTQQSVLPPLSQVLELPPPFQDFSPDAVAPPGVKTGGGR